MIFLDTNIIVAAVGRVDARLNVRQQTLAFDLMRRLQVPTVACWTSEAVLAETTQVLQSPFGGNYSPQRITTAIRPFIAAPGLRIAPKHIYLRALDVWASRPRLGFVDALTVAYVEQGEIELASFDRQLLASPGVTPYWPESAVQG